MSTPQSPASPGNLPNTEGGGDAALPQSKSGSGAWKFWVLIAGICVLLIGISVSARRWLEVQHQVVSPIAKYHKIEGDLEAQDRTGKTVKMSDLNGKVRVIANIYTICPHGCAAVIGEMLKLEKKFGTSPEFYQVSMSVVPERDTVEMLDSFAKAIGLGPTSPWWFLTGDQQKLWSYMTDSLKLDPAVPTPEDERLNPQDIYSHDLRVVLVDREGYVRGYYSVFHPEREVALIMSATLQSDVERLLNDPKM